VQIIHPIAIGKGPAASRGGCRVDNPVAGEKRRIHELL